MSSLGAGVIHGTNRNLLNRPSESQLYPGCNIHFVFRSELILGQYVLQVIVCEQRNSSHWELTGEGQLVAKNGSHEALIFNYLSPEGTTQAELIVRGWMDFEKCSVLCSVIAFTDCLLFSTLSEY